MNVKEMFNISGKVALITGGGRGIGKTIAEAFGEAEAKIIITGRREEWLNPTIEELRSKKIEAYSIVSDVSKPEDTERISAFALEKFGKIDILVNNAGVTWGQPTEDYPLAKWQQILDINLTGIFLMSQKIGKHMIERGQGGQMLNIASVAGISAGDPESAATIAYNTTKAGVIHFTRALAKEWGPKGIRVNAIAPGWFPTRMASGLINANRERFEAMTALKRIGELDNLKGVALFLVSEASAHMTGQILVVDGGASL